MVAGEPEHGRLAGGAGAHHQRPAALGQPPGDLPQDRPEQPRFPRGQVGVNRPHGLQARPFPAAFASSRQRSSTDDRNPATTVTGIWSWPAACRKISSIWVARAAPVDTYATYGGCSPSRPIAPASATPWGQAITIGIGVPPQLHIPHEPAVPNRGTVKARVAQIIDVKAPCLPAWSLRSAWRGRVISTHRPVAGPVR